MIFLSCAQLNFVPLYVDLILLLLLPLPFSVVQTETELIAY
jgi:hypothetical protein